MGVALLCVLDAAVEEFVEGVAFLELFQGTGKIVGLEYVLFGQLQEHVEGLQPVVFAVLVVGIVANRKTFERS